MAVSSIKKMSLTITILKRYEHHFLYSKQLTRYLHHNPNLYTLQEKEELAAYIFCDDTQRRKKCTKRQKKRCALTFNDGLLPLKSLYPFCRIFYFPRKK